MNHNTRTDDDIRGTPDEIAKLKSDMAVSRDAIHRTASNSKPHATPSVNGKPTTAPAASITIPEYQPFPHDALPPGLREFAVEIGESVDCDLAFAAGPALAVAGAAAGAAVVVSPKRIFREPPAVWIVDVGDSGTGKSPASKPSYDLGFGINKQLKAKFNKELADYICAMEVYAAEEEPDPEKKPRKPVREYFGFIDATIERIGEMAGTSPRGLILLRDELDGWFGSFSRYKGKGGGSDVPNWLSMFDAGPISYHRRTGEPRDVEVDRAFVAVAGGVQPDILARALSDPAFISSGLAARLLFVMPPKHCPRWSERELSEQTEQRFRNVLTRLRDISFDPKEGPAVVKLTTDAKARFVALNNHYAAIAENCDGPTAAVLPKAVRIALRLALIHHIVTLADRNEYPAGGAITDESMYAGANLSQWFVGEAGRVYAMLSERPEDRELRKLAETVKRKGGRVTHRDLQRGNSDRYKTAALAEAALETLVSAGLAEWHLQTAGPTGGRPTKYLVLRDSTPTRHNPPATDTTPTGATETPLFSEGSEVVSGSVGCRVEDDKRIFKLMSELEPKVKPTETSIPPTPTPTPKRRFKNNPDRGAK